jgi:hypothetical protein
MADHKTIEYNGSTIHYLVSGNKEGEAIVFLHPTFGDYRCCDRQVEYFFAKISAVDFSRRKRLGISD